MPSTGRVHEKDGRSAAATPGYESRAVPGVLTTTHAEITAKIPGLRSYVQNICLPDENGDPAYDGVALLAFDDMESMQKALGTPEWEAVLDDVPKFVDDARVVIMIAEDNVVV
ncbi:MAG: EthD family reductase [Actinomycetota bacterium]|nr:EthD family reductase [Actinomycetota bacterium]